MQLLVENAGKGASAVAQVQRILPRLWQERKRGWLTTSAYNQLGGVAGSFERNLAEARDGLLARKKKAIDTLLRSLVYYDRNLRLNCDTADWRDLATIPDLAAVDAIALRDRLADRHLIELHRSSPSTAEKERTRIGLVFPTPESYGKVVELVPDPTFALWRRRFAGQLQGWQQNERSPDFLLKGAALVEAEDQAQRFPSLLTQAERDLITASAIYERAEAQGIRDREAELARRETESLKQAKETALLERDHAWAAQEKAEEQRQLATTARQRSVLLLKALAGFAALLVSVVVLLVASRRSLEESRSAPPTGGLGSSPSRLDRQGSNRGGAGLRGAGPRPAHPRLRAHCTLRVTRQRDDLARVAA